MKIKTTTNQIIITLDEDEKLKEYNVANRDFGEKTKQIWIKLIKNEN